VQNYLPTEACVRWRTTDDGLPKASQFVSSPFVTDAHLGRNNTTGWVGYNVHLTETCEDDALNLITYVDATAAPTADGEVIPFVHPDPCTSSRCYRRSTSWIRAIWMPSFW
jgi:hypothetical protein